MNATAQFIFMKKRRINKKLLTLLTMATLLVSNVTMAYASTDTDDPGSGRLSGKNISKEWYDEDTDAQQSTSLERSLTPYGSSQTVNPYTGKTYTHQDGFDGKTILNGIDVSQWNRTIDWQKVKAAGIDFAFIRVGYRGYGQNGTLEYPYTDEDGKYHYGTKDPYYEENMKNAIAAGVRVGVYIFSQAITEKEAIAEAQYILNHIKGYSITMPLIMDYEYASDSSTGGRIKTANLSKDEATKICMAFCETIANAGYTPMIYANKSMLNQQLNAATLQAKYPIWLANYTTNTDYSGTFQFWQYSSDGKVDGIEGRTDMNYYYVSSGDNYSANTISIQSVNIAPITDQAYTGGNITPAPILTYQGKTLVPNTDYTLSYKNNCKLGTATITIVGKNTYKGTRTVTFKIAPKMVTKFKAKKATENSITLTWKTIKDAKGYIIYRSNSLNGSYKAIATIKKYSTKTYTDKNLTSGQCYYYQIRCYKKVGKTTHYGVLTPAKAVTTKISYTRKAATTKEMNLYKAADANAAIVKALPLNATLTITYCTKDSGNANWYFVTYKATDGTFTGFVPSSGLSITKTGKIAKSNVNLRKSNSTSSKILYTMKKNTKVTVLKTKTKKGVLWYKITFKKKKKTYTGWVASPYLKAK